MPRKKFINDIEATLSVAVWLASDDYDFTPDSTTISCTDLLKSDRQLVLRQRRILEESKNPVTIEPVKLSGRVASRMGQAIHGSIEDVWLKEKTMKNALIDLGYPARLVDRVRVNPTEEDVANGCVPIYMEIRSDREIEGIKISGKFDFIGEGRVEDFKTTSVFTYKNQTNTKKYILQGSIYRWLNPRIITDDTFQINYIFTDWSRNMALSSKDGSYPKQRILTSTFNLMSIAETEHFIKSKLRRIAALNETPEENLPDCTSEELWQSEPVFKYYSNPDTVQKGGRATKNFGADKMAANQYLGSKGKGIVLEVPSKVGACKYCSEFSNCSQKDRLIASGLLEME